MESKPNMSKTESVRTLMMQGDPCMIGVLFSFAMKGEGKRMRTMQDQMQKWIKANNMTYRPERNRKERKHKRNKERMTEREIKELMGVCRPVYRRGKGGAFRQR